MQGFYSKNKEKYTTRRARAKCAPPFIVSVPAVASVLAVSVSVVCDQVDQVVPAHQVDDIDEVHELDPVHQVDHKDEPRFCVEVVSFCALCGRQPRFCVEVVSFCAPFC